MISRPESSPVSIVANVNAAESLASPYFHAYAFFLKTILKTLALRAAIVYIVARLAYQCTLRAPIVYRLGHQVFILVRGVRLSLGVPFFLRNRMTKSDFFSLQRGTI